MSFKCKRCGGASLIRVEARTQRAVLGASRTYAIAGVVSTELTLGPERSIQRVRVWYECEYCESALTTDDGDYFGPDELIEMLCDAQEKPA